MKRRDWFVQIVVRSEDGTVEALDTWNEPEVTGIVVTDAEREELRTLRDYVAREFSRIVNRRAALFSPRVTNA